MPFEISFPKPDSGHQEIKLEPGEVLFVLGANGTGKSRMMHRFFQQHAGYAERISAHRQTFLAAASYDLGPQARRNLASNERSWNSQQDAAWVEHNAEGRSYGVLFDLVESQNQRARLIMEAVDARQEHVARALADKLQAPLTIINELFKVSNLPIEISIGEDASIKANRSGATPYDINRLSDGERNALIISAKVLTAKPGSLLLIDEPERHLHRAIISPLLTYLFARRNDCTFIVSTHDVSLAADNSSAKALLLRRCQFAGENPTAWDADLVEQTASIDDAFKIEILGARRCTLFVEGQPSSLDNRLYGLIFEGATVVPRESCRDVIQTVTSINSTADLHWVRAFGIVDNDNRRTEEIDKLRSERIYALPAYSVESIYYDPEIQKVVAFRKAKIEGGDADADLQAASKAAFAAISRNADHLCRRRTERDIRHEVLTKLPSHSDLQDLKVFGVSIDVVEKLTSEKMRLDDLIRDNDLVSILARYPVRESGFLNNVAKALRFVDHEQYETAVITALIDEPDLLTQIRKIFQSLIDDMKAAS